MVWGGVGGAREGARVHGGGAADGRAEAETEGQTTRPEPVGIIALTLLTRDSPNALFDQLGTDLGGRKSPGFRDYYTEGRSGCAGICTVASRRRWRVSKRGPSS